VTPPPEQRITRDDIEAKFRELQGEVEVLEDEARNYAGVAIAAVVVTVVVVAFLLGRRKGRKGRVVVQVRRV